MCSSDLHIEEISSASVYVEDGTEGQVRVTGKNVASVDTAIRFINSLVKDVTVGDVYAGKVVKIMNFGAFIELVPGKEGLVHISNLAKSRVNKVEDVLAVGQNLEVKVKEIDSQNRINLIPTSLFD